MMNLNDEQFYRFSSQLQVAPARSCTDVTLSLVDTESKSVLINPHTSAMALIGPREHAVIDCVALFYEEGKTITRKISSDVG